MKKLHKLVLSSYIGPFVATFFLALFILLMQFLWKYIDDLVGKGLEWYIIGELLFYSSATFVPLALPLAVLLSSIMTMGAMGEHYELVAFKSAGISLNKIMWPLVVISGILVLAAFYFSNNVLPVANLKSLSLLYDVRHHRPAFNIMEGVYYKGIDNFVIRVSEKDADGQTLRDIKIYDHSGHKGNVNLTTAEWGTMAVTPDKRHLLLSLYNGVNYQETGENPMDPSKPFQRTYFTEQVRKFDLSSFDLRRTDEDLFKSNFRMLNLHQLVYYEDSLSRDLQQRKENYIRSYMARFTFYSRVDSTALEAVPADETAWFNPEELDTERQARMSSIINQAMGLVRTNKDHSQFAHEDFRNRTRNLARYQIEFHRKFTLSFACMVLFMIGAPLGAIIRKGGFGLPMVVSVLFFVVFHVVSITGEKFAREGVLEAWQGMWIAPALLMPVGIILIVKATTDSSLLDMESYTKRFDKLSGLFRRTVNTP
jgi:lipopolysaccharide export system permease protein